MQLHFSSAQHALRCVGQKDIKACLYGLGS